MKKKFFPLVILLLFPFMGFSQSCFPNGIEFNTQEEIDNDLLTNLSGINCLV